jgi:low temperature requirement protein LtrA
MGTLRRLVERQSVHAADGEMRHATWLELFFDLVFVAAIANLGTLLHDDRTLGGVAAFAGLLAAVWWAWISFSYFAGLFDDDSPFHRVVQLAAMLGAAVLAVTLSEGVVDDGHVFALAYAAMFALLTALYALMGNADPQARELCHWYTAGSAVGAVLWAVSAAVPAPGRYGLWAVAVVLNAAISGPIAYARMRQPPVQVSHMPERFGLFTIVVLGEAVLAVVDGIGATSWQPASITTAVSGFVIAACIWWVYFGAFDETAIDRAIAGGRYAQVRAFFYGYGHLIIYAAIVAVGVGVEVAIEQALGRGPAPALLGWGVAALIAGFIVIGGGMQSRPVDRLIVAIKLAIAVVSIVLVAVAMPAAIATTAIAVGWVALVAVEVRSGAIAP